MKRYSQAYSSCKQCYNEPSCKACRTDGYAAGKSAVSTAGRVASAVGSGFGRVLSFLGQGDYTLKSNSLVDSGGAVGDNVKITYGNTEREVRIVYREYLKDITTTSDGSFKNEAFNLQPTDSNTFPWLSSMAGQWEQCRINGIMMEYKSLASDSNTGNRSLGSTMMATEYDIFDKNYANKQEFMNSAYANEAKVSAHIMHGVECARGETFNPIIFTGASPTGADPRDYSIGKFQIATQGGATGSEDVVGSLYIHYDITFFKEQMPTSGEAANGSLPLVARQEFTPNPGVSFIGTPGLVTRPGYNIQVFSTTPVASAGGLTFDVVEGETYEVRFAVVTSGGNSAMPTTTPASNSSGEVLLEFVPNNTLTLEHWEQAATAAGSVGVNNTSVAYFTAIGTGNARLNMAGAAIDGAAVAPRGAVFVSRVRL